MKKILVSACLIGEKVRYHGGAETLSHSLIHTWQKEGRLVPICPEMAAGLPAPRAPSEIEEGKGGEAVLQGKVKVIHQNKEDVSEVFIRGANLALELAKKHDIEIALLKEKSPSCGTNLIYTGKFNGEKISGQGVTASLLQKNGIKTFSEDEIEEILKYL